MVVVAAVMAAMAVIEVKVVVYSDSTDGYFGGWILKWWW
jgi:hypothetical protein